MHVSVVIATYNRCDALRRTLERLEDLDLSAGDAYDVIVVDNNSSDGTADLVREYAARRPDRFRYLLERRQGKSFAVNTGIQHAAGDILVFTDDDCIAERTWLSTIIDLFASDSSLAGIGGRVELYTNDDLPVTIRTSRDRTPFTSPEQLFSLIPGCNMAFRREVVDAVGRFDPALGPGNRVGAAEDTDFLYRAYRRGFKIVYTPEPVVYHNHGRRTGRDVFELNRQYVIGRGAFYAKHIRQADTDVLRMAYWETLNVIKSLGRDLVAGRKIRSQCQRLSWLARGAIYGLAT